MAFRTSLPLSPPYAPGPNASGAAAVALSAPPADPTPAGLSAMESAACTTSSVPPHPCVSTPEGSTSLASMSTFTTVPASPRGSETQEHSAAHVRANCSAVVPAPALSAAQILALSPSRNAVASPRLRNATSRVAAFAVVAIAIIAATTVATNTKAQRSDGCIPRCTTTTCSRECPRSRSAQTTQPRHHNPQAVYRTRARHRRRRRGPHASPGTRKRCLAQWRRESRHSATKSGWKWRQRQGRACPLSVLSSGPRASPGTRKRCPAQQRRATQRSVTDSGWKWQRRRGRACPLSATTSNDRLASPEAAGGGGARGRVAPFRLQVSGKGVIMQQQCGARPL